MPVVHPSVYACALSQLDFFMGVCELESLPSRVSHTAYCQHTRCFTSDCPKLFCFVSYIIFPNAIPISYQGATLARPCPLHFEMPGSNSDVDASISRFIVRRGTLRQRIPDAVPRPAPATSCTERYLKESWCWGNLFATQCQDLCISNIR